MATTIISPISNVSLATAASVYYDFNYSEYLTSESTWNYFKIIANSPSVATINASIPTSINNWGFYFSITNSTGSLLAGSYLGYSATSTSFSAFFPVAGTYYIKATSSNIYSASPYTFSITSNPSLLDHIEAENNGTLQTANPINLGLVYFGQLSLSDKDYYKFDIAQTSNLYLNFAGPSSKTATNTVSILDQNGKTITTGVTDKVTGGETLWANNLSPGTYSVLVTSASGTDGNNYQIFANTYSTSSAIPLKAGIPTNGSITSSNPINLYSVQLIAGQTYGFSLQGLASNGGTLIAPTLTMVDSTGKQITELGATKINNSTDLITFFTTTVSGTYFIDVSSPNNIGTYKLSETLRNPGTIVEVAGNSTMAAANPLLIGDIVTGTLATSTSTDYYSITVQTPTVITPTVSIQNALSNWAYGIKITDSNGNTLGGTYLGSGIAISSSPSVLLPNAGVYYIKVDSSNIYSSDPYTISVNRTPAVLGIIESENNGTQQTANPINFGMAYYGQLSSTIDKDYYKFEVKQLSNVYVNFTGPSTKAATDSISILNSNGVVIASGTTDKVTGIETLWANNLSPGTYSVLVSGASGSDGNNYQIFANTYSTSSAIPLTVGAFAQGYLTKSNLANFYTVKLVAGTAYELKLDTTTQNCTLSILTPDGISLESYANGSSRVQGTTTITPPDFGFIAPYSGNYQIACLSTDNSTSIAYQLSLKSYDLTTLNSYVEWRLGSVSPNNYFEKPTSGPLILTYCFLTSNPSNSKETGFLPFTSTEQSQLKLALDTISAICGIQFNQTLDEVNANIRYANSNQTESEGYAIYKGVNKRDVFINVSNMNDKSTPGSYLFNALIHETGHALGLKHPGDYNLNSSGDPPFSPNGFDSQLYWVMSYLNYKSNIQPYGSSPMSLDIAALQDLYGLPKVSTAVNFVINKSDILQTATPFGIYGSKIDASAVSGNSIISLTAGSYSSMGNDLYGNQAHDNIVIPWGSQYTGAVGGIGNDFIICNDLGNSTTGGAGNDTIYGGAGRDVVSFSGNLTNYKIEISGNSFSISDNRGTDGTDTMKNIEALQFMDKSVNLTVQATAKAAPSANVSKIIELYLAFLNREPDADGLEYWINQLQSGKTINQIAETFYYAGVEFSSLTGYSKNMANDDFINLIYKNVFKRDGADPEGLSYWRTELVSGRASHGSLVSDMLYSAHTLTGNATYGWVANLLDNKIAVARTLAIDLGINFNSTDEKIIKGMMIAAAVTPTDTNAAIGLIGINITELHLV